MLASNTWAFPQCSKQNEHLLSVLLSPPMDNAFADELRSDLVTDCLLACPSLLSPYLEHWTASMVPRNSDNWLGLMAFVNHVGSLG